MVDIGLRKAPLAGNFASGQLVALRQPGNLRWRQMQVGRESIDIEIVVGHTFSLVLPKPATCRRPPATSRRLGWNPIFSPNPTIVQTECRENRAKTCLDGARKIATIPPPFIRPKVANRRPHIAQARTARRPSAM